MKRRRSYTSQDAIEALVKMVDMKQIKAKSAKDFEAIPGSRFNNDFLVRTKNKKHAFIVYLGIEDSIFDTDFETIDRDQMDKVDAEFNYS